MADELRNYFKNDEPMTSLVFDLNTGELEKLEALAKHYRVTTEQVLQGLVFMVLDHEDMEVEPTARIRGRFKRRVLVNQDQREAFRKIATAHEMKNAELFSAVISKQYEEDIDNA